MEVAFLWALYKAREYSLEWTTSKTAVLAIYGSVCAVYWNLCRGSEAGGEKAETENCPPDLHTREVLMGEGAEARNLDLACSGTVLVVEEAACPHRPAPRSPPCHSEPRAPGIQLG